MSRILWQNSETRCVIILPVGGFATKLNRPGYACRPDGRGFTDAGSIPAASTNLEFEVVQNSLNCLTSPLIIRVIIKK